MVIHIFEEGIDRIGGVERVICTLANGLARKYKINVTSFYKTSETSYFKYNNKIDIKYLSLKKFKKSKNKYINYVHIFFKKLYEKLILNYKLKNYLKNIDEEDIIICGRVDVALKVIKKINKKNKIIVRDAIHYFYFNNKIKKEILHTFPKRVNTFIVSSEESLNQYKKIFGNSSINLIKIYNPLGIIPVNHYNFDYKTIISVGRYSKQKGFENLIKAFDMIYEKYPEWSLKIIGNNNDAQYLNLKIDELKSKPKISLVKHNENIVEELIKSSIFVMTSRYEGYANALVEALACGIPSVSYDWLLGAEEIIQNEINGKIVKLQDRFEYARGIDNEKDIENLSNAIMDLIENKEKCETMSKYSANILETRDTNKIIDRWIEIIEEVREKYE